MRQVLSPTDKAKFISLLGLSEDASHEQIQREMTRASEAQAMLIAGDFKEASRPQLVWAEKLLVQKRDSSLDAFLFWELFFDYDAEHKLGFMDAEMEKTFPSRRQ